MARVGARDFVGARVRFQRVRDAKIFNGWIESFFGNTIEVSTSTEAPVEIGDEFRMEGFGHHISVVFNAKLESVATFDVLSAGAVRAIEGSNARIIEAKQVSFSLTVCSQVRFSVSEESVRMKVGEIFTRVKTSSGDVDGFVVDVGPTGIGTMLRSQLTKGDCVEVVIATNLGDVKAMANVRYSQPDRERKGLFRTGLMFTDMGRIERPRWERFLREVN